MRFFRQPNYEKMKMKMSEAKKKKNQFGPEKVEIIMRKNTFQDY